MISLNCSAGYCIRTPSLGTRNSQELPLIGVMSPVAPSAMFLAEFPKGLAETGYRDGQKVVIEYRSSEGHDDLLPELAAQLARRHANVIVTTGTAASARAARDTTSAIPIVFHVGSDPVAEGLVIRLASPEGKLTGVTLLTVELHAKRFELLSELVPQARTLALLLNPNSPSAEGVEHEVRQSAKAKPIQLQVRKAATDREIDDAFTSLGKLHVGGLIVQSGPFFINRRERLTALAARHSIPAIYEDRRYVEGGGLTSYGPRLGPVFRQFGIYAGKILSGAKPSDLPAIQPTTFELVVNLKTARTLGLSIPQSIPARADEVIE